MRVVGLHTHMPGTLHALLLTMAHGILDAQTNGHLGRHVVALESDLIDADQKGNHSAPPRPAPRTNPPTKIPQCTDAIDPHQTYSTTSFGWLIYLLFEYLNWCLSIFSLTT